MRLNLKYAVLEDLRVLTPVIIVVYASRKNCPQKRILLVDKKRVTSIHFVSMTIVKLKFPSTTYVISSLLFYLYK